MHYIFLLALFWPSFNEIAFLDHLGGGGWFGGGGHNMQCLYLWCTQIVYTYSKSRLRSKATVVAYV